MLGERVDVGLTEPMQRNIDVICDLLLQLFYVMDHLLPCPESKNTSRVGRQGHFLCLV
jgi:hypothetical protein